MKRTAKHDPVLPPAPASVPAPVPERAGKESGTHNTVPRLSVPAPDNRATRFSELFASMINHELRNALNAVSTAASLLEMRAESDKMAVPVSRITLSAGRMDRMLSQLVDFARIEIDGALVLVREPFELDELVLGVVEELPADVRQRVEVSSRGDAQGAWDRDRITQLVGTLIGNALQHGAQDKPVRVHIEQEEDEGFVRLEVENEGSIAPEALESLFVAKRRKDREHTPRGLGLGLYVARCVALAHGGTLEVLSAADRTLFTLRLPAQHIPIKGDAV